VEQPDARPEIYAFGFRNVWRLAFDSKTGDLWAADVGQDLWEEINLVRKGGNYGWSVREGLHPFGQKTKASSTTIEPVWEYDHRIGRSITGGRVYRSSRLPELTGKYLYADYVTGRVWALDYDRKSGRVLQNLEISPGGVTVTAFGEDAQGEVYYVTNAANGQCIYRLERK
jgi:glucose/arabinose dehydrogenase